MGRQYSVFSIQYSAMTAHQNFHFGFVGGSVPTESVSIRVYVVKFRGPATSLESPSTSPETLPRPLS